MTEQQWQKHLCTLPFFFFFWKSIEWILNECRWKSSRALRLHGRHVRYSRSTGLERDVFFFFLFLLPFQLSALHTWSDCPEIAGGFCVSVCLRSHEKKGEVTRCGTGSGGTQRVAIPFIFTPLQRRSCIVCTNTLSGSDPTLSLNLGRSPAILAAAKQQQQGEKMERTGEI